MSENRMSCRVRNMMFVLVLLTGLLIGLQAQAADDPSTYVVKDGVLVECTVMTNDLVIPDNLGITKIGDRVFENNVTLRTVKIPEGVTEIGDYAFYYARYLEEVTIPDTVKKIGDYAFYECSFVDFFNIPKGVTEIGEYTFFGGNSVMSISIPEGVTRIGDYAFAYNTSATSIKIPSTVTEIGNGAFSNCYFVEEVQIPGKVTKIGSHAFANCNGMKTVNLPASLTEIGDNAFYCCESLNSVSIPAGVKYMGEGVFYYCTSLKSASLAAGIERIGIGAFQGCSALTMVSLPASLTEIADSAFLSCESLKEIALPAGLKTIGAQAFRDCYSLQSVSIPHSVTSIGEYSFGCSGLKTVSIPASISEIPAYAFYKTALSSVVIPSGVRKIGGVAFAESPNLKSVSIAPTVKVIGADAFRSCAALESVVIPEGVEEIGSYAFAHGLVFRSIVLPASLKVIGDDIFNSYITGTVATVVPGSKAEEYCIANGFSYVYGTPEIKSAAYTQSMQADGSSKVTFTVRTSPSVSKVQVYLENNALLKTVNSGYTDADGVRTWMIQQTFSVDGERIVSFKGLTAGGEESALATIKPTVKCAKVTSAAFSPASVTAGSAAKAVVKTSSGATHLALYTETGAKIRTYDAAAYSTVTGNVRTWNVSYTFSGTGNRSLTFKASVGGGSFSTASKTAALSVISAVPAVNSASYAQTMQADGSSKVTFTVKTNTAVTKVKMYIENNALLKSVTGGYTDANGVRTWKIDQVFSADGVRTVSFGGVSAKGTESAKLTIKPTVKCAKVTSAAFSPASVTAGSAAKAVVKTSSGATHLALYTETGAKIRTYDAATYSTVTGNVRTWNVSYTFSGTGNRSLTFKASVGGGSFSTASKTAKLTVTAK